MVLISVTVITLNEEKNIAQCLQSVKGVADEILVVDSFSSDRTVEIAKEHGARTIVHEFSGHIQQKNFAQNQAKYDYILSLDADEALSLELKQSILEVKSNWAHDSHYLNRLSSYCGRLIRHGSWIDEYRIRLYDRRKACHQGKNPHDKVALIESGKTKTLKGDLLHYRFKSIRDHVRQTNYFSDITAKVAFEEGKHASWARIVVNPIWRFFKDYFLKHGFLGGKYGFAICLISSWEQVLKYLKLYELQIKAKDKSLAT